MTVRRSLVGRLVKETQVHRGMRDQNEFVNSCNHELKYCVHAESCSIGGY